MTATHRHSLASAFAEVGMARMSFAAGDHEDCLLTLQAISRDVEGFQPRDKAEAFTHRKITVLLDRLINRMKER